MALPNTDTAAEGGVAQPTRLYLDTGVDVASYMLGHGMRAVITLMDGRVLHVHLIDGQSAYDDSHFMLIGREEPRSAAIRRTRP